MTAPAPELTGADPGESMPCTAATAGLPQHVIDLLTQPLDRRLVAHRRGANGRQVPYIEGFRAIEQANDIFGYGNWGAEVVGPVRQRQLSRVDQKTGEVVPVTMYWAVVRVTVAGCRPRSDVGCACTADGSPEAHETALKGAVTDAMKRALRGYGSAFGNALYSERERTPDNGVARARADLQATLFSLGAQLGMDPATVRERAQKRTGRPFDQLTPEDLARLVRLLADRPARQQKRPAA